jgi:type I restriction enzyme S subunit
LCGNVRLAHEQFHATEHAVVATPRTGIDVGWLYYSLDLLNLNRFATGQAQPGLSVDVLENVALAISPLAAEQQKIADCLSSLDELIAAQARKVEALKTHKKGLMQQLFPREGETQPGLRFSEFESLGEWSALTIQELIDKHFIVGHLDGNHGSLYPRADEFSGSGVPYISATNFNNGGIDFERCKYLPVERAAQFKKGIARDGDILFAHNATVGPVAKLTMKYDFVILSTSLTYFRCNGVLLLNDFLKCALVSPAFVDQCARVMAQSTRNQIPITTQRTFGMQIPKLPEQQRIADCLNSLNDLITASIQELDTLKIHKEGLMQQLFPSVEMIEQ